jgi:methylenetetrahydrofolate reductase (NADPH)
MTIENQDKKITDFLKNFKFTLSAEVIPPRNGAEQVNILKQIEMLVSNGAQFLSVTKGAGGSLRGGSLPIAHAIKDRFKVPSIAHFTCRDLTPQDVENQLIDHHYFGIRNILALRGDPPTGQKEWKARDGSYSYAYQLIEQIRKLNQGEFLQRPDGPKATSKEKTNFSIGCAVYPEHPIEKERLEFFKLKVENGAEYAISQMLFDTDAYAKFLELTGKAKITIPVLPGTRIIKTRDAGERMAKRFEISLPKSLAQQLATDDEMKTDPKGANEKSLAAFARFTEKLKSIGAPGLHVFVLSDTEISCELLQRLKKI